MSQQIQLICDTCGRLRGPSNHWLALWTSGNLFTSIKTEDPAFTKKDFCGSVCLMKEVAKLIDASYDKGFFEPSSSEIERNRQNFMKGLNLLKGESKDAI